MTTTNESVKFCTDTGGYRLLKMLINCYKTHFYVNSYKLVDSANF
jgi:hypothetical protein